MKVWLVLKEMKTLLELMLVVPNWARAAAVGGVVMFVGGFLGVVVLAAGVGAGVLDLQTEGCPLQINPVTIWQLTHPADELLPVSQVSDPTIMPSPHLGAQTPWALGANPEAEQVKQTLEDLQVAQEELQAVHPLLESKNCPAGQEMG